MALRRKALVLLLLTASCGRPAPAPLAARFVDLYKPEAVEGRAATGPPPARTEWRFDGPAPSPAPEKLAATRGWDAFHDVSGLAIRSGRLAGRSTGALPIVHIERTVGLGDRDVIHEVELHLRVSAGADLSLDSDSSEKLDRDQFLDAARSFPWSFTTPVVPGDEIRTYTLRSPFSQPASRMRHLFLRPTDVAGASFEIESVRLVFRREHLAGVPSGVGWQGLSEVYREAIVSRSPETVRLQMTLPERPWLDLGVGTIEDGPVTFRVAVRPRGTKDETPLLVRTVTRPHRWEPVPVELQAFAGREVDVSLSLASEKPAAIGFWGSPVVRARGAAKRPQGVILVWADTLRRDHLGVYGYPRPTSPVLDRLAAEGVLFRDCVGQATWTKVATPSLLTSLYPTSHGVKDFADRLPSSATTLAEAYRDAGYATLSFSSILFTGKLTNLHQGFEELHEDGSLPDRNSSKTAREYVDHLLPWIEAHRDAPFFVLLHVADPHDPYKPYPPYDTLWANAATSEEHERRSREIRKRIADPLLRQMGSPMPTRDELVRAKLDPDAYVAQERDWYDGSIRALDVEMGRLVERLRSLGLEERTLVVLTADHGEEFLEHGRMFHGQSVYGELNNMPLIFWGPGVVPKGLTVDSTVQTIDLMPTLLEMSGVPVPAAAQGRSLVPLLGRAPGGGAVHADAAASDAPAISEKAATSHTGAPPPRDTESVAIVSGGWKLIHNVKRGPGRAEYELFDHQSDPLDQKDVAAAHPDLVERLAKDLVAWRQKAKLGRLKPDSDAAKELSKDDLERLRALGYIQ